MNKYTELLLYYNILMKNKYSFTTNHIKKFILKLGITTGQYARFIFFI